MSTPAITAGRARMPLVGAIMSTDHKSIGMRTMAVSLIFFLGGGVMALIMRSELAQPGLQVVSTGSYNALFSMHGSTMVYLFVIPLAIGVGVYMVPLQVGAAEIAGPRVALSGFWLYVVGGIIIQSGWLVNGGPGRDTWIAIAPLSEMARTPGSGMDLWILGVMVTTLGQFLMAMCVLFTALRKRAPGMTLLRMPPFTWTEVATTLMIVFAFPVLVVLMALLWWDRKHGGIFTGANGPIAYQQLFWFYGHPVVYVMFFPFSGMVAEVFCASSGRRMFGYPFFVGATVLLFAALSSSVWGHHMFTTGRVDDKYFSLTSHMIILAAGIEYFDLMATLWGGRIRFTVPFLFGIAFFLQFLVGGLSGIWTASPTLDFHANNSYIVVGHFHYTLFAGSIFGAFAGVYYWWPKWFGHFLRDGLGKVHFWLIVVGTNLTFAPMFWLGEDGMTRRIANYPPISGWGTANLISSIGSGIIGLAVLVFLVNIVVSVRNRRPAPADPWEGPSLEWATTSPPPRYNFDALPPIRSYAPMVDLRERARDVEREQREEEALA